MSSSADSAATLTALVREYVVLLFRDSMRLTVRVPGVASLAVKRKTRTKYRNLKYILSYIGFLRVYTDRGNGLGATWHCERLVKYAKYVYCILTFKHTI